MTLDRRNFLARLAALMPAVALASQFRTHEENERLKRASFEEIEQTLHPMRYLRSVQQADGEGRWCIWTETSDSPDGPWVKLADRPDGTLQSFHYPPVVRHGLPPLKWRQLNRDRTESVIDHFRRTNELLNDLPWKER